MNNFLSRVVALNREWIARGSQTTNARRRATFQIQQCRLRASFAPKGSRVFNVRCVSRAAAVENSIPSKTFHENTQGPKKQCNWLHLHHHSTSPLAEQKTLRPSVRWGSSRCQPTTKASNFEKAFFNSYSEVHLQKPVLNLHSACASRGILQAPSACTKGHGHYMRQVVSVLPRIK